MQRPRDKPFIIGAKYIKHHHLKCSLKSIIVNRYLNAVVILDVITVELGKAFHSDLNAVVTLDVITVELGKAFHSDLNAVVTLDVITVELGKAFHSDHI